MTLTKRVSRSDRSLIQTIGRAARNAEGEVIMYADEVTRSMEKAIYETERRRAIQQKYNEEHGIIPKRLLRKSVILLRFLLIPTMERNLKRS